MVNVKEEFEKLSRNSFFSRVDNEHILDLYLGIDDKGRKAIELHAKFKARKVLSTSAIEVNQWGKPNYNIIRFSLINGEMTGLFYKFCEDLIEQTRDIREKDEGYNAIVLRYMQWKKMFVSSSKDLLSETDIMGLIGEILYLRGSLAERIGLSEALRSWSGQELTHKDFSYGNEWAEVKTISYGATFVKISSLEQLDSEDNGELAVFSLEKMSEAFDGITLNKLVLETKNLFSGDEQDDFLNKVCTQGYEYNTYYDSFVYTVSEFRRFRVDNEFPRLTPSNVPEAVRKAKYEISIDKILDKLID